MISISRLETPPSSRFYCTTEEGEMVVGDWKPSAEGGEHFVQQVHQDHFRPNVSLTPSPFFPQLLLSVGDAQFNIWKKPPILDEESSKMQMIFSSSSSSGSTFTSGVWSPTRAGVIFIGWFLIYIHLFHFLNIYQYLNMSYVISEYVRI